MALLSLVEGNEMIEFLVIYGIAALVVFIFYNSILDMPEYEKMLVVAFTWPLAILYTIINVIKDYARR